MKKLKFAVEDIAILEEGIDKSQFSLLKVDAFATGASLHDTFVTEETLRKTAKTILLKPFVFEMDERFSDLGTHSSREVAGGFVPHNSPLEFKKLGDGRVMLSCHVLIWKRYSGRLLEFFNRDGGKKGVSVEIEIKESRDDPKTGLMEIVDFVYDAITGLGDLISPAIPDANAILAYSKDYEKDKQAYVNFSKYDDVDFSIPEPVKARVKKSLDSKKGSPVAMSIARFLASNEKANAKRVRQIYKFLKNKDLSAMDEDVLGLYGGQAGFNWARDLAMQLDEIDSKQVSFYAEDSEKSIDREMNMAEEKDEKVEEMASPPEEEKKEEELEKKEEEIEKKEEEPEFSYAEALNKEDMSMFAEDDEDAEEDKKAFAEAKAEFDCGKKPFAMFKAFKALFAKMSRRMAKLEDDNKAYMAENEELKKFKFSVEEDKKALEVDSTLKALSEKFAIPDEKLVEMKERSSSVSFAELESWKDSVKVQAVDFAVRVTKETDEKDIVKYAFPFNHISKSSTEDVWAN